MRKGILNSIRCAPPAAAPKTSDESPPWHATYHGIYVRILPGYAWVTPPRELSLKLLILGPVGR